jgi:hypothetical protein
MTPVLPAPIMLPYFVLHAAANVYSVLVVSFTALLYLAMTLVPFLPQADPKLSEPESPDSTFNQGEEK